MKTVGLLLFYFILYLIVKINGHPSFVHREQKHAITTIGASNVTFTWTIKNYSLINWNLLQSPETIDGPFLEAKNDREVQCKIHPLYTEEQMNAANSGIHEYIALPKLVCKFNSPQPIAVKYSYESNGITKHGVLLQDIEGNDVKITLDAFYSETNIN